MILEVAVLDVRVGQSEFFEAAFAEAQKFIAQIEGFRGSSQYERWRELLHQYYEPFPEVEHYQRVEI